MKTDLYQTEVIRAVLYQQLSAAGPLTGLLSAEYHDVVENVSHDVEKMNEIHTIFNMKSLNQKNVRTRQTLLRIDESQSVFG